MGLSTKHEGQQCRRWILMLALIVAATAAKAQAQTSINLTSSPTTTASNNSNGTVGGSSGPTDLAVEEGRPRGSARQDTNAEFQFTLGPIVIASEPKTMFLFGSGLLLLAGIIRRWMRLPKPARNEQGSRSDGAPPGSWTSVKSAVSIGGEQNVAKSSINSNDRWLS